jgi:hypothetical protein
VTSYMICYQIRLDNNVLAVPNKVPLVRTSSRSIPRKEISCAYGTATFTNGPMCARPGYAHLLPPPPKEENDRPSTPGGVAVAGRTPGGSTPPSPHTVPTIPVPRRPYCSNYPLHTPHPSVTTTSCQAPRTVAIKFHSHNYTEQIWQGRRTGSVKIE